MEWLVLRDETMQVMTQTLAPDCLILLLFISPWCTVATREVEFMMNIIDDNVKCGNMNSLFFCDTVIVGGTLIEPVHMSKGITFCKNIND